MRANELELLRSSGVEPCLLMDTGGETGRLPFGEAALALRPGVNLLDNWYFAGPVNQRGLAEYTGAGCTIDRFYSTGPLGVTVEPDGIKIYNPTEFTIYFIQKNEVKFFDGLVGRSMTISALYICDNPAVNCYIGRASSGGYKTFFNTGRFSADGKIHLSSGTGLIPSVSNASNSETFGLEVPPGATVKLMAAKLELGPRQTLAHKEEEAWVLNDPPPNKTLELLKCQRYFLRLPGEPSAYTLIGHGKATSNSQLDLQIPIPAAMRGRPSVRMTGEWVAVGAGMCEAFTAENMTVALSSIGTAEVCIIISGFTGLIPNHVYTIQRNNDGTGNIELSSEM